MGSVSIRHFITGSHKANYTMNPSFLRRSEEEILDLSATHSPLISGYDCPPGSAIFFAEATCQYAQPCPTPVFLAAHLHPSNDRRAGVGSVGPPWQADHPRVSVLHLYAHV